MINEIKVFYINLDIRLDRRKYIEEELNKLFGDFTRIPAENGRSLIEDVNISPMVGCALSHIIALKEALKSNAENIIIVEDDFQLEITVDLANNILNNHLNDDFNLILLSYHIPMAELSKIQNNKANIKNGQTTCAYMVKKKYINNIIENLEYGLSELIKTKDLDKYSLDQYWKLLQKPENKVYASVPRIGKQRSDYSDIVNSNVSYGGSGYMGILSCARNEHKRVNQDLSKSIFEYKYFIGNPELTNPLVDGNIVYLPCGDGYEHLTEKTKHMVKWIMDTRPTTDYIFKTDDDININFEKLSHLFANICLNRYDYCGKAVNIQQHISTYHYGKCLDSKYEIPVVMNKTSYCAGGGYFLSKKAALKLITEIDSYKNLFEDYSVGYTLNSCGISPINVNIHNISCFW